MAIESEIAADSLKKTSNLVNRLNMDAGEIVTKSNDILAGWGLEGDSLIYTRTVALAFIVVGASFLLWWLTRNITLSIIHRIADKTKTHWDDELVKNKFFSACAHLIPLLLMDYFMHVVFYDFPNL